MLSVVGEIVWIRLVCPKDFHSENEDPNGHFRVAQGGIRGRPHVLTVHINCYSCSFLF